MKKLWAVSVSYFQQRDDVKCGTELAVVEAVSRAEAIGSVVLGVREKFKPEEGWLIGACLCVCLVDLVPAKLLTLAREVAKVYEDAADWKDAMPQLQELAREVLDNA